MSKAVEVHRLKGRVQATDAYLDTVYVVHTPVDDLTVKRALFTTVTEHTKAECNALTDRVCKLEVNATTGNWKLCFVFCIFPCLKNFLAASKT